MDNRGARPCQGRGRGFVKGLAPQVTCDDDGLLLNLIECELRLPMQIAKCVRGSKGGSNFCQHIDRVTARTNRL
jgi:hypothetical protein